jgi:uncharacterized protein
MKSPALPPSASATDKPTPWWRVPMVWVVISGPLSVVVASLATAVVAWRHIDPVLEAARPAHARPGADVPVPASPKDSLAPAMRARNHAATPQP